MNHDALEAFYTGVNSIATDHNSKCTPSKTGYELAFMTQFGLCLIGIREWFEEEGYFDAVWRVFLGEISNNTNILDILGLNYSDPDTPFGIALLNDKYILTNYDRYRFLFDWGPARIARLIYIRFGGAFMQLPEPRYDFDLISLDRQYYIDLLYKYEPRMLLDIPCGLIIDE